MNTALAVRPSSTVPSGEWNLIATQADMLARSDIIPRAYQRKPANVVIAALTGRQYGWDVLTAMRNGHIMEGEWRIKPEAALGLVRRAGHSVKSVMLADGAEVTGTRKDNGDTMTVTFTFADAVTAGLCTLRDGKPYARSSGNKTLPWENYPVLMCFWRAVGVLCRTLFSDVTGGGLTAEEMGAPINEDGDVIDAGVIEHTEYTPQPLSEDALTRFKEACFVEGLEPDAVLREAFPGAVPDTLTDEHLPTMRDAFKRLAEQAAAGEATPNPDESSPSDDEGEATDVEDVGQPEARPATRAQVGKIKGEYERLGFDRDRQLAWTGTVIGHAVDTHNALTVDEAQRLIDSLTKTESVS